MLPKSVDLAIFATWAVLCATIVSTVTLTPGILVLMMAPMLCIAMLLGALRNGKRDAVPNRMQPWKLEADQPGEFVGQCTEFCGLSHANMRMEVVALNAADFETWKANQLAAYEAPEEGTVAAGEAARLAAQVVAALAEAHDLLTGSGWRVRSTPAKISVEP